MDQNAGKKSKGEVEMKTKEAEKKKGGKSMGEEKGSAVQADGGKRAEKKQSEGKDNTKEKDSDEEEKSGEEKSPDKSINKEGKNDGKKTDGQAGGKSDKPVSKDPVARELAKTRSSKPEGRSENEGDVGLPLKLRASGGKDQSYIQENEATVNKKWILLTSLSAARSQNHRKIMDKVLGQLKVSMASLLKRDHDARKKYANRIRDEEAVGIRDFNCAGFGVYLFGRNQAVRV